MAEKRTAPTIFGMKAGGEKIACITAYDATSGMIADAAKADLVLVGDSVGNTMLGYPTTVHVTLQEMIHHTSATSKGVQRALLVADLPFGSYQSSVSQAVDSSVALMKAGGEAVKLEGAYVDEVRAIVKAGIPVMGHVGMTPQSYHAFGGFKVQGKSNGEDVVAAAKALEDAGVFAIVLELIPADLAARITSELHCPTIGIGAGPHCDGQVQVFHDILGLTPHKFKHAKRYVEGMESFLAGITDFVGDVKSGAFPTSENSF